MNCTVPLLVPRCQTRRVRLCHLPSTQVSRPSSRISAPNALTTGLQLKASARVPPTRVSQAFASRAAGRDIEGGEKARHHDVGERAHADHEAHHRPAQAEHDHRAGEHGERGQKRQQERVVHQVERPHAARDLAHRGAGEGVRMPIGREALHARERVLRHASHDAQRQLHDAVECQVPHDDHQQAEARHAAECDQRRMQRCAPVAACSDGIDEPPCEDGHEHVGERGDHHGHHDERHIARLRAPVAEGESQNVAGGVPALLVLVHGSEQAAPEAHASPGICAKRQRNGGLRRPISLVYGLWKLGKVCRASGPHPVRPMISAWTWEERSASRYEPCSPPSLEIKPRLKVMQFARLGNRTFTSGLFSTPIRPEAVGADPPAAPPGRRPPA